MAILPKDAVHPNLVIYRDKLTSISEKRHGLLAEFPTLSIFLNAQINMLATRDIMFAHDFAGNTKTLLRYAKGEMAETAELIPIYNEKVKRVGKKASMEGGDVFWFLAMGEALRQLNPTEYKLSKAGEKNKRLLLQNLYLLSEMYTGFKPEKYVDNVVEKNRRNYPDRPLRAAPDLSVHEMSAIFENERLPALKRFRSGLHNRVITPPIYDAIQNANPNLPRVPEAKRASTEHYENVIRYSREASQHYAY